MVTPTRGSVLVTAASSYIGMHVVVALLRAGYAVRGTTRNLAREPKLRDALPDGLGAAKRLSFVALDMLSDDGWSTAVDGCDFVVHLASPLPKTPPKHEDEIIKPAVEGTKRAIDHAIESGVRRVVVISSLAAVHLNLPPDRTGPFDENDWSVVGDGLDAYSKSKILAEKAAWARIEALGDDASELVVLNPGFVLGPMLGDSYSSSLEWVRKCMTREIPGTIDIGVTVTDVRDLADLFVRALEVPAAAGKRFCITGHSVQYEEMARTLAELFGPRGVKIRTVRIPTFLVRVQGLWDPAVQWIQPMLGKLFEVDTTRARNVLGFEPRPLRETLEATGESLIASGKVRVRE